MPDPSPSEPYPPDEETEAEESPRAIDPVLAYIILIVITVLGLRGLAVDVRYTIVWSLTTVIAVFSLLADRVDFSPPHPIDLVVGSIFGGMVGVPLLAIGGSALKILSAAIFAKTSDTAAFLLLAFAMPLAETAFFRGAMQASRGSIVTGLAASLWAVVLFSPQLDLRTYPFVALVIGLFFVFANFLYSYLRDRFGILSAWTCQITINLLLLFAARFVS
ncbi:MAG TPA: hypothetical protein VMT34_10420 [Aggregatilineales bacterium]|nr:hypothetical protein [Aggregatilineales bacterium]